MSFVQDVRQVGLQPRFEFDCPQRRGAADVEHVDHALSDTRLLDNSRHVVSEVVHVPMPLGLQGNLFLVNHAENFLPGVFAGQAQLA